MKISKKKVYKFHTLVYRMQSKTSLIAKDVYNEISGNWKPRECYFHSLRCLPPYRNEKVKAFRDAVALKVLQLRKENNI